MAITIKCSVHPKYMAVRAPTSCCDQCELIYDTVSELKMYLTEKEINKFYGRPRYRLG